MRPMATCWDCSTGAAPCPSSSRRRTTRAGPEGPARLARLLAELADRDLLAGVPGTGSSARRRSAWRRALLTPHELVLPWAGRAVAAIYRRGGWLLFTRIGLALLAAIVLMGLGAFVALDRRRLGDPARRPTTVSVWARSPSCSPGWSSCSRTSSPTAWPPRAPAEASCGPV